MSVVLDSGALMALERGDRLMTLRVDEARRSGLRINVPAGCLAQAWRAPARQARLATVLKLDEVQVPALDGVVARRIGLLLAASRTADVIDAHVAVIAIQTGGVVYTSDPDDIRRLAPTVRVIAV